MSSVEMRGPLSRPLRNRNFLLLWVGQSVSNLGNAMYRVTLAWSVVNLTGSSTDLGIVLAANVVPQLLLTLFGGAVGDRWSRRTVIVVSDAVAAGVAALLALATHTGTSSVTLLVVSSFALGVVGSFHGPAHYPLLRSILPVEDQQAASAIYGATYNVVTIAGPLVASLVFVFGGVSIGFAVDSGTFVFSAICAAVMAVPPEKVSYAGTMLRDVRDGLRFVLQTGWLRTTILLSLVANVVCIAPLYVLLPGVVADAGGDGELLGIVMAIQALSAASVSLLAGKYGHRVPRGVTVYGLVIVTGVGVALVGLGSSRQWMILLSMVILGVGFAFNVIEMAMIQELVPKNYLSRVYSVNTVASFALAPVGYTAAGIVANATGATAVLVGGGLTLAVVALVSAVATRWRLAEGTMLDRPVEPAVDQLGEAAG